MSPASYNLKVFQERHNKMNVHNLVQTLSPSLKTSQRLLTALLYHCRTLFPNVGLSVYVPPLSSGALLPESEEALVKELLKQESFLSQLHAEMNEGFYSQNRQEMLWEVQRILTQLKVFFSFFLSDYKKCVCNTTKVCKQ